MLSGCRSWVPFSHPASRGTGFRFKVLHMHWREILSSYVETVFFGRLTLPKLSLNKRTCYRCQPGVLRQVCLSYSGPKETSLLMSVTSIVIWGLWQVSRQSETQVTGPWSPSLALWFLIQQQLQEFACFSAFPFYKAYYFNSLVSVDNFYISFMGEATEI